MTKAPFKKEIPLESDEHIKTADYLRYLFTTGDEPDSTVLDSENAAALRCAAQYKGCRLQKAEISRAKQIESENGLPRYLVQMQVTYQREPEGGSAQIRTAMTLIISRNANGAYIYRSFSDAQRQAAAGGAPD